MELGWEMLGGMCTKVGTFARAIYSFAPLAGLSVLLGALSSSSAAAADACEITTEEVEVCGKAETVTHLCGFPYVTAAMTAEATKYEILKEEYARHNGCVSTDPDCKALDSKNGGDDLKEDFDKETATQDVPGAIRFHLAVTGRSTDSKFTGVRDDAALLSKKGFVRDIVAHHHLVRHNDSEKFHEDAEGVALANKELVDKEKAELEKQAAALSEMKAKFEQNKDKLSEENTAGFEAIAKNRAIELAAVSCELKRLAGKDRRIENRISKVIVDGELTKGIYGQGSPDAASPNHHSDISGALLDQGLPNPTAPGLVVAPPKGPATPLSAVDGGGQPAVFGSPDRTGGSSPPPSMTGASSPMSYTGGGSGAVEPDDPLSAFGPDPDQVGRAFREVASAPAGVSEENDALFDRVKRQYRAREQKGDFRPSLVD